MEKPPQDKTRHKKKAIESNRAIISQFESLEPRDEEKKSHSEREEKETKKKLEANV